MTASNPFLGALTGEYYALGRPDYHPAAVGAVARLLDLGDPLSLAVDVGCGTGMSTRALTAVAAQVVGLDVSASMLRAAAPAAGVGYLQAGAERLPLASCSAGLVVTAAAFHWFDQARALAEVARVLRPGGGFAVYSDFFSGRLGGADALTDWLAGTYRPRYPGPPRRSHFDRDAADVAGLAFVGSEELRYDVPMTADALADYLLSQSNATSAIDDGRTTRAELRAWLLAEFEPRMPAEVVRAQFTCTVWCSRK
ncbi:class I SAM-dependent methyltransferase [Pseudonocardia xinjiangensis]|uniref:class I SAM-dependent methyltransferase n=1 Tax=Pseudonocardia xinjiangensis TaxID=75289 RepID=UPI003D91170A